jgi:regulator of protease activity HflC (stomatin/prohibitin superfamily)
MCETKTKDNVFVKVNVAVQYRILVDNAYDAYYRLTDPVNQIQSYVFDVIRSTVPKMELDEAFQAKEEVAEAVLTQLRDVMADYGYENQADAGDRLGARCPCQVSRRFFSFRFWGFVSHPYLTLSFIQELP